VPDESVPEIQNTNRLLTDLLKSSRSVEQQLAGNSQLLHDGLSNVRQGVGEQTNTLVELQILSRLAEMASLLGLIQQESKELAKESAEDSSEINKLRQFFDETFAEISALRNRRVRELLASAYALLDDHHDRHIEAKLADMGEVLDSYQEVTTALVNEREEAMREVITTTCQKARELEQERRVIQEKVKGLQIEPARLATAGHAEAFALPFYLVEVELKDGTLETRIVPPSRLATDDSHPFGIGLKPVTDFEPLRQRLAARVGVLLSLLQSATHRREQPVADSLPTSPDGSFLDRWARASMKSLLRSRSWTLLEGGPPATGLKALLRSNSGRALETPPVSTLQPSHLPAPNLSETSPEAPSETVLQDASMAGDSSAFDQVLERIGQGHFQHALVLLQRLAEGGEQGPLIALYQQYCMDQLSKDPQEGGAE
jgi:hypothetical protein